MSGLVELITNIWPAIAGAFALVVIWIGKSKLDIRKGRKLEHDERLKREAAGRKKGDAAVDASKKDGDPWQKRLKDTGDKR